MFKITFDKALTSMRRGFWVRRKAWPASSEGIRIRDNQIIIINMGGTQFSSLECEDILADDWEILDVTQSKDLDKKSAGLIDG